MNFSNRAPLGASRAPISVGNVMYPKLCHDPVVLRCIWYETKIYGCKAHWHTILMIFCCCLTTVGHFLAKLWSFEIGRRRAPIAAEHKNTTQTHGKTHM